MTIAPSDVHEAVRIEVVELRCEPREKKELMSFRAALQGGQRTNAKILKWLQSVDLYRIPKRDWYGAHVRILCMSYPVQSQEQSPFEIWCKMAHIRGCRFRLDSQLALLNVK